MELQQELKLAEQDLVKVNDHNKKVYRELNEMRSKLASYLFNKFFSKWPVQVVADGSGVKFGMTDSEGNVKEVFSLYASIDWSDKDKLRKIEISYYTTGTKSEFEIKRLVYLGKLASLVLEGDLKNGLINEYKKIDKYEEDNLGNEYPLKGEIQRLKTKIYDDKMNDKMKAGTILKSNKKEKITVYVNSKDWEVVDIVEVKKVTSKMVLVKLTYGAMSEGQEPYTEEIRIFKEYMRQTITKHEKQIGV